MRTASGVWRWRHNPLCRRTDLTEAWVALVAVVLIVLSGPLVGWFCGTAVDRALDDVARAQHLHRHPTTATVIRALPARSAAPNADGIADAIPRGRAAAQWTGRDGSRHTGELSTVKRHDAPGDRLHIWTDDHGEIAARPMTPSTARAHAVLAGFGAAAATAGVILAGRRLVVWLLVRRRYVQIDRDWAEAGPDWGRTGTGS